MNLTNKNILITGATGSLGKQLIYELVSKGHKPLAHCRSSSDTTYIDSLGLTKRIADLRNEAQLEQLVKGIDLIIHTAAIVNFRGDRLTQFTGINTFGALQLYRIARKASVGRFVQVSSVVGIGAVKRAGENSSLAEADESTEYNLASLQIPYFLSKRAAEVELLKEAASPGESQTELVIVNPSIIVAPSRSGDDRSKAEKLFGGLAMPRLPNRINLVDSRDVASGIVAAAESGISGERYILAGENLPISQLLLMVGQKLNKKVLLIPPPRFLLKGLAHLNRFYTVAMNRGHLRFYPDLVRLLDYDWAYNSGQARKQLGFNPRPLSETLDNLLDNDFRGSWANPIIGQDPIIGKDPNPGQDQT